MWVHLERCSQLHERDRIREAVVEENEKHTIEYEVSTNGESFLSLLKVLRDNVELPESEENYVEYFCPTIGEKGLEYWIEE